MAQTNYTPISLYYSTTASAVPTAANLVPGELAINTNDGKLYYEDSSGVVQVLATKSTGSIGGSNTQVQFNNSGSLGGSSGLTWDGSFLTTSSIKNSALTSGRVTYAGASGLLSDSAALTFNGNNVFINGTYDVNQSNLFEINNGQSGATKFATGVSLTSDSGGNYTSGFYISSGSNTLYNLMTGSPTTVSWYSANVQKLTLTGTSLYTASGVNVGIGTSSPRAVLDVSTGTTQNSIAVVIGPTSGTATVGNAIKLGFALQNTGGGGTGNTIAAGIGGIQDASASNSGALGFYTQSSAGDGTPERMRIDSSGNVMIGNTVGASFDAISKTLSVGSGSGTQGITVFSGTASTGSIAFADGTSGTAAYQGIIQYEHAADALAFYVNYAGSSVSRMRIDSSGNLFVNCTTTPSASVGGVQMCNPAGTACKMSAGATTSFVSYLEIINGNGVIGSITGTGSTTTYSTSSDYRLKENIAPMTGALATVAQLNPVTYKWKSDGSDGQGFIAHELQAVVPDCVTGEKDAVDADGKPKYQGVDTSFLVATLVSAIQEQQALIESLTTRLTALENK
jgi:hypothetical protein